MGQETLTDDLLLARAYEICIEKHAGQTDKVGKAYFMHPVRVAERCATLREKMVALLHDTVEDTDVTPEYLLERGFPREVVDGVLSVTKRAGEDYMEFVRRASRNPLGAVVKLHDLEDNMDLRRLYSLDERMVERFNRYIAAYHFLKGESEN